MFYGKVIGRDERLLSDSIVKIVYVSLNVTCYLIEKYLLVCKDYMDISILKFFLWIEFWKMIIVVEY